MQFIAEETEGNQHRVAPARRRAHQHPPQAVLGTLVKRELRLLGALLTVMVVVAACGSHADSGANATAGAATTTPAAIATTAEPTPTPTPARAVSIGEPFVVGGMQVTIRSAKYACTNLDSGPLTGELCPANAAPTDTPLTIELAPVTKGTPGLADLKYWLEDSSGSRIDIALDMADSKSGTRLDTFLLSSRSTDLRLLSANGEEVSLSQILVGL